MSTKKPVLTRDRYKEILSFAQEFAPELFKPERPLPPMAIGTAKQMNERGFRDQYDVKSREFGTFMHWYTNETHYLHQLAKQWWRIDLDGKRTDKVSEEESQTAIKQLKERGIDFKPRKRKPKPKKEKKAPDLSVLANKFKCLD